MENERYKILLIEDDKLDQMAFKRFVESESLPYDFKIAGSVSQARSILGSEGFDIIISDFSLGDGTAFDVLGMVKNIPVVLVTGAGDEGIAIKAWKAGAYDYLRKDHERNYLKAVQITIENTVRRKRLEETLNQKQKNLEAIFDAAPVAMLLVDEQMIVNRVNDAVRQMVHREYSEIIGQRIGGALGCTNSTTEQKKCGHSPSCAACSVQKTIKSVLDSGQPVHGFEIQPTLEIDNKEISPCMRMSAEPVMIDGRNHVVIAVDDITKRKKAEHELQAAEERYRTIFENSAVAITMADEQERLISWNKFTEDLLGMTGEDLYLRPVKSLYPEGEWERIRTHNVRQKGMQHHLETKIVKKDGSIIDIDISISVLKNSEGKTTGSVGVFRDITERKKAKERLERSFSLLHATLESTADGILVVDNEGKVASFNHKFVEMWRIPEDVMGTQDDNTVLDYVLDQLKNPEEFITKVRELYSQPEAESFDMLEFKDGRVFERYSQPQDVAGKIRGRVWSFRDITERKKAEEKLIETMEIKSQFISTVSHELRTPLTSMKESVSIVLDEISGKINEQQRHFLNIAERNIGRLSRLINDVLDFQKLGSGKMKFDMQENNINEVVTEAFNTMLSFAKKKEIDLSLEIRDNPPKAIFDSDRIIQVVTNLISNAVKFTPEKGKVSVSVGQQQEELVIRISDTGMGIPKEVLPKIFERFYCVNRPGKQIQGTGLGLAIVNKIVIMHSGRIDVESEPDKGTTFAVFLPLTSKSKVEILHEETDELLENTVVGNTTHTSN